MIPSGNMLVPSMEYPTVLMTFTNYKIDNDECIALTGVNLTPWYITMIGNYMINKITVIADGSLS